MKENQRKLYESILSEIESGKYKQLVKGYGKDPQGTAEKIEKISTGTQQASGLLKDVRMDAKKAGATVHLDKSEHKGTTHANTGKKVDAKDMFDAVMTDAKPGPIGESIMPAVEEPIVYGIPDSNKYPLNTPQRVVFAIRIFNTIREEFHQQFAEAIVKQAQKFGIDLSLVPETSSLFKYLPRADKAESKQSDQHIAVTNPKQPVVTEQVWVWRK
jgi:hypothetical protein